MAVLQEIKIPQESVNDEFVTVVSIFFNNGEFVEIGDVLIELETSKAVFAIESEVSGYVKYFCVPEQDVAVNATIIKIFEELNEIDSVVPNKNEDNQNIEISFENTVFSIKAQEYIQKNNIDLKKFQNSDFVSLNDVLELLGLNTKTEIRVVEPENVKPAEFELDKVFTEDISKNKKREIEYLKSVQRENLNSNVEINIDTQNLFLKLNSGLKYFKNALLPVIVYESARLLKKYPEFNSYFSDNKIAMYNEINVGFAVDMGNGLKTLNIRNTLKKSIAEIETEIFELSNKYIDNKLTIDDLSDITFTITDLSSEGINSFIPLINKNNSAILGISANDEKLDRTTISLSFDHRVTAGKQASIFLRELKERVESYKQQNANQIDTSIRCYKCFKTLKDDFNDVGFLKVVVKTGEEKYICQTCFTGF